MKRAQEWTDDLAKFLQDYRYQPKLTLKLDALAAAQFDQDIVNEIVLWKVNRYAPLEPEALAALNGLKGISCGEHRTAEDALQMLLRQPGIDLPMASTLMRFRNPDAFQIVDRHAYRAVNGDDYPLHSTSGAKRKAELYFDYLDQLVVLAKEKGVAFRELDRILYIFDKQKNGTL